MTDQHWATDTQYIVRSHLGTTTRTERSSVPGGRREEKVRSERAAVERSMPVCQPLEMTDHWESNDVWIVPVAKHAQQTPLHALLTIIIVDSKAVLTREIKPTYNWPTHVHWWRPSVRPYFHCCQLHRYYLRCDVATTPVTHSQRVTRGQSIATTDLHATIPWTPRHISLNSAAQR